jgi:hypothetical protein
MPRLLFSLSIAAAVLASVASTACTTHTIVHVPARETVSFEKSCAKTACEAQSAATPSPTSHCSECIDAIESSCISGGSCDTSQCDFACNPPSSPSPPACSDDTCLKYTWVAHATGFTAAPEVEQGCIDTQPKIATRCGLQVSDDTSAETEASCARTARFYTEAAVPDSACLDAFDCKTGQWNCERTSTNGDHFCATREASCGSPCTGDIRDGLNHLSFGMKPALIAALQTCASQSSCEDVDACLTAWFKIFE